MTYVWITLVFIHALTRLDVMRSLWKARARFGSFYILQDQGLTGSYDLILFLVLSYAQLTGNLRLDFSLITILFIGYYALTVLGTILFALYLRGKISEVPLRTLWRFR